MDLGNVSPAVRVALEGLDANPVGAALGVLAADVLERADTPAEAQDGLGRLADGARSAAFDLDALAAAVGAQRGM